MNSCRDHRDAFWSRLYKFKWRKIPRYHLLFNCGNAAMQSNKGTLMKKKQLHTCGPRWIFRAVKTWPGLTCRHTVMLQSTPLRGQGRGTMVMMMMMMMMMMQFHWQKQLASQNTSDWSVSWGCMFASFASCQIFLSPRWYTSGTNLWPLAGQCWVPRPIRPATTHPASNLKLIHWRTQSPEIYLRISKSLKRGQVAVLTNAHPGSPRPNKEWFFGWST